MNELNLFKHIFCFENKSFQISIDFVFPSNSFNGNFLSAMIFVWNLKIHMCTHSINRIAMHQSHRSIWHSVNWHTFTRLMCLYKSTYKVPLQQKSLQAFTRPSRPTYEGVLNLLAKYAAGCSIKHCLAWLVAQQQRVPHRAVYIFFC